MHSILAHLSLAQLIALDALLEECSVVRAAGRVGVSPSALSHALSALRQELGDPLLVRAGRGMIPTPRALGLQAPLRRILNELEDLFAQPAEFDPKTATNTFRIAMPSAFTLTVLPTLLATLQAQAPAIDLVTRPVNPGRLGLEDGDVDLVLYVGLPNVGDTSHLRSRVIGRSSLLTACRRDHPEVGSVMDLETYCRLPHILMSPDGRGEGIVDHALAERHRSRRIALRLDSFIAAPLLVANTDMLLTGPDMLLTIARQWVDIRLLTLPLEVPSAEIRIVWHERRHSDPGHRWLRDMVVSSWTS